MSTFSKKQITDMIYDYCVKGLKQEDIANELGIKQTDVSKALSPYKITGKRSGNKKEAWQKGKSTKKYRPFHTNKGQEVYVTRQDIKDYLNVNYGKATPQDFDTYLNNRYGKLSESKQSFKLPTPAKVAAAIVISIVCLEPLGVTDLIGLLEDNSGPSKTFSQELKEQGADKIKDEAKSYIEDTVTEIGTDYIEDTLSDWTGYQVDYFSYDGYYYSGNKKGKKPDDLCFRHDLNVDTTFDIGYFNGDKISGQCVELNHSNWFVIGEKKKSELNGWCIDKNYNTGVISIAKYKNDTRKGKGILIKDGVTTYVDFDKSSKQLAVLKNGKWIRTNGKELNVKDIEIVNDTMFKIDGIQIGVIYDDLIYKVDNCDIRGNKDSITYINVIEDGTCEVEYQYQKLEYIKIRYKNENGFVQAQEIKLSRKE